MFFLNFFLTKTDDTNKRKTNKEKRVVVVVVVLISIIMFYSIDLLSPKGALGNVWVMMLLFRDAIFVRVGSLITRFIHARE